MNKLLQTKIGKYVIKEVAGESYRTYIPTPLPPLPSIDIALFYPILEKATFALAKLNNVTES